MYRGGGGLYHIQTEQRNVTRALQRSDDGSGTRRSAPHAKKKLEKKNSKKRTQTQRSHTNVGTNAKFADVSTRGSKTNLAKRSEPNIDECRGDTDKLHMGGRTKTRHKHGGKNGSRPSCGTPASGPIPYRPRDGTGRNTTLWDISRYRGFSLAELLAASFLLVHSKLCVVDESFAAVFAHEQFRASLAERELLVHVVYAGHVGLQGTSLSNEKNKN